MYKLGDNMKIYKLKDILVIKIGKVLKSKN